MVLGLACAVGLLRRAGVFSKRVRTGRAMTAQAFDPTEFRKALGTFATGVTIITARTVDGTPVGLTANSFNSVSLSPPLVLWSLANTSANLEVFRAAEYWAVHVLATDQEALSGRFSKRGIDKFARSEARRVGKECVSPCRSRG